MWRAAMALLLARKLLLLSPRPPSPPSQSFIAPARIPTVVPFPGFPRAAQGFEMVRAIYIESPSNLFSVENDLLTPTFKLKRAPLQKRYQAEVDAMYAALKKA